MSSHSKEHILTYKDVVVNLDSQAVERQGKRIDLTAKEYKLLVFLMRHPGQIATKSELIDSVWELQYYPESNIVEVLVNHLRGKLDKEFDKPLIHSKRGTGYWFGEKEA
jgi:two-component system OmpR family response regulator